MVLHVTSVRQLAKTAMLPVEITIRQILQIWTVWQFRNRKFPRNLCDYLAFFVTFSCTCIGLIAQVR